MRKCAADFWDIDPDSLWYTEGMVHHPVSSILKVDRGCFNGARRLPDFRLGSAKLAGICIRGLKSAEYVAGRRGSVAIQTGLYRTLARAGTYEWVGNTEHAGGTQARAPPPPPTTPAETATFCAITGLQWNAPNSTLPTNTPASSAIAVSVLRE